MADEVEEITLIGNGGDEPPISLYLKKDEIDLIKRDPVYADIIYRNALRAYKTNAQKDTSSESKEEEQNVQDPSDKSVAKESDTITSDDLPKLSSIRWGREATLSLLKIYKELEWKLSDPTVKKKAVWQEISSSLEENGFIFSPDKCERKMLNMKRDYKSVIDHNNTTGNDRKSHPYMDELHSIFGLKPSVKPLSIAASFNTDKFAPKTNESDSAMSNLSATDLRDSGFPNTQSVARSCFSREIDGLPLPSFS